MPVGRDFRLSFYTVSDLLLAQLRGYATDEYLSGVLNLSGGSLSNHQENGKVIATTYWQGQLTIVIQPLRKR
jgi:hypothetical protein